MGVEDATDKEDDGLADGVDVVPKVVHDESSACGRCRTSSIKTLV
jgi:hypothetical protein